jgi:hypothetical protein
MFKSIKKVLLASTVPTSKNYLEGTVPSSKNYLDGTVPSSKNLVDGTSKKRQEWWSEESRREHKGDGRTFS